MSDASLPFLGMYDAPNNVTAVDANDDPGNFLASLERPDDIWRFHDLHDLLPQVANKAGDRCIDTFSLIDHGSAGVQEFGDRDISSRDLDDVPTRAAFQHLGAMMCEGGSIELMGCNVADSSGEQLMRKMAAATGHPVTAGFDYQRQLIPGWEGSTMTCYPPTADNPTPDCVVDEHPKADAFWEGIDSVLAR